MHTKGPWKTGYSDAGQSYYVSAGDAMGMRICTLRQTCDDAEANAKLISAAPELLEALEGLASLVHAINPGYEGGDPMEAARAAIKKARG